ncbi:glycosyltransferase [Exiguobacterium mexicanum]|uniref:glycosyltransferase n=1 Tax=Exiguobacterium mexicanum TaxID=340146 RepID=UPI0037BF4B27
MIFKTKLLDYNRHKIIYPLRGIKLFVDLIKIIENKGPYDIIHCHNGWESGICVLVAKLKGINIRIVHSHGVYINEGKNIILKSYNNLNKKLIQHKSSIKISCSDKAGESLFGLNSDFCNVLNPIKINPHLTYTSLIKNDEKCINILQIGYYASNKNQIFSLSLLKKLIENGYSVHLNFIGYINEKNYFEEMKEYIDKKNLNDYVSFLPHDYDKQKIFSDTSVLLLPSHQEGLGIVLLEAQAAGVKCIASSNVSSDANLGLCQFVSLKSKDLWIEKIININNYECEINMELLEKVSIDNYLKTIRSIYYSKK